VTALSNTYYSLTLFLALVALSHWTGRRHPIPCDLRAGDARARSGGTSAG